MRSRPLVAFTLLLLTVATAAQGRAAAPPATASQDRSQLLALDQIATVELPALELDAVMKEGPSA